MNSLANISREDVQELDLPLSAFITDVQPLSSYNWIEAPEKTPTIMVPGIPARWTPPQHARQLKKDSGLVYIAQNAARHPYSPLEPLFRAVYKTHPDINIQDIDVVTDRNNIRKLLSFITWNSTDRALEPFTIDIEVVQNTAIFCRTETATHEIIGPHEFKGFGHEFEKNYTSNQISGSTGHHRIVQYRFGGMNILLRHEVDGYVGDAMTSTSKSSQVKDLSDILESLSLNSVNKSPSIKTSVSNLIVKQGGEVIALEKTLEIKTRVRHRLLQLDDVAPQLWISQTPKLVRAYHFKGVFHPPTVEDVTTQIKIWELDNQHDLKLLAALITRIIHAVKACGGVAVLKYHSDKDQLVISKVSRKALLPEDLYVKWKDGKNSEKGPVSNTREGQTEENSESDSKPSSPITAEVLPAIDTAEEQ